MAAILGSTTLGCSFLALNDDRPSHGERAGTRPPSYLLRMVCRDQG
uniref:Uncharacterized protein n=1 Tax=Anguilla anguilla TaxID=7936 RepID=A0A0E9T6J8_ANGAN